MTIKALLFDVHDTLIEAQVDEEDPQVWVVLARYLSYKGIYLPPDRLREIYWHTLDEFRKQSPYQYPEPDVLSVWAEILQEWQNPDIYALQIVTSEGIEFVKSVAQLYRSLSLRHLALYPGVKEMLTALRDEYRLAVVNNGQRGWSSPELKILGIRSFFELALHSSDHGRRKPDPYMFQLALQRLGLPPEEVLCVGNDLPNGLAGALAAGMPVALVTDGPGAKTAASLQPTYTVPRIADLPGLLKQLAPVPTQG